MANFNAYNPFARRETHSKQSIITYKILTLVTWLLYVITTLYYLNHRPHDGPYYKRTIWGQARAYGTPFNISSVFVDIYWIALWILQVGYVWHLFSSNTELVSAAASVGSHFIVYNLVQFGWVMLWVRGYFWLSELMLVINFFNLISLYFRHSTKPRFVHIPVVSAPLAWTFVAIFWNGAVMVNAHHLSARIVANVAVWSFLVFGGFFLMVFKDYTIGFALSFLTAGLGVAQFKTKAFGFQWIFAFTIMAVLFVGTLIIALPASFGRVGSEARASAGGEDRERQPLLNDH